MVILVKFSTPTIVKAPKSEYLYLHHLLSDLHNFNIYEKRLTCSISLYRSGIMKPTPKNRAQTMPRRGGRRNWPMRDEELGYHLLTISRFSTTKNTQAMAQKLRELLKSNEILGPLHPTTL